jgi:alginate O-acetyltransferase complex protein AlgI
MLFNSFEYLIFLPLVLTVYYVLTRRAQNAFLVVASYVFYGWWDWRFCGLIAASTLLDYFCGLGAAPGNGARRRRVCLIASLAGNLGILGFFKYFDFFSGSVASLLTSLGMAADLPTLQIILPVGISFYTFQTMSYTIDVYRGDLRPTKDFIALALYVGFFPQLVAGPIERGRNLLPQMLARRVVDNRRLRTGLLLILIGYFKKVAIADAVAPEVNAAFGSAATAHWLTLVKGGWLFAIQIYCDFSGYSDIARGTSRLLGFELMENFNQPYLARNITEFWRRWHISLSTWLRDYLYIPLGGNRRGPGRTYLNLMTTMLLGGLWHGANWTFVVWGGLHGLYLAAHKAIFGRREKAEAHGARDRVWAILCILFTFHLVLLTWVFFRAPDFGVAFEYLKGIVTLRSTAAPPAVSSMVSLVGMVAVLLWVDLPQYRSGRHTQMLQWRWWSLGLAITFMSLAIFLWGPDGEAPFIYFQF